MRIGASPFAVFKPAFWRQKDENENNNAQDIPLPGVSGVIPKKQLSQCAQHVVIVGPPMAFQQVSRQVRHEQEAF